MIEATPPLPVAVIGAGPVGLAAAANLTERDIPFVLFEVGDDVAASVRDWEHVQLFSPWRFNLDPASQRLLEPTGWVAPDGDEYPTGAELIDRYLAPLALLPEIAAGLRTNRLVTSVTRAGLDKVRTDGRDAVPFVVTTDGPHGVERTLVSAVIDASGTWTNPNPLGADGVPAPGERRVEDRIDTGIPDVLGRDRIHFAGRRVAVVGSGHSAQNVVRDLAALAQHRVGTEITWVLRRADAGQMFGGGTDDQLPERGRLGADARAVIDDGTVQLETGFRIDEVTTVDDGIVLLSVDGRKLGPFDRIVAATGFRPDLATLGELRIDVDPALESSRALGPADRPQRPLLRIGPSARRGRAGPPRARGLRGRRQELRASTDVPARHRLRAGPLGRGRHRRRSRRCRRRPAGAARDRRVLARPGTPTTEAGGSACCG